MNETELLDYLNFRQSTHLNYHRATGIEAQQYGILIPQTIKFVQQDLPTSMLSASDDPKLILEHGIRQWTGYGAPKEKPAALAMWIFLAFHQEDIPLPLKARAHSSLARGYLDLATENALQQLNIERLYDAGNSANEAVTLGLISPAALAVASRIESAGFRRPEDNRFPEYSTERFERLTDLWAAFDVRKAEMAEEDSRREAKVSRDALSYFCTAEDCGIVATKKSTLKRCGGKCPPAFKPSYCSKYCQTADWKRHKPYCRPGAVESSVCSTDTQSSGPRGFAGLQPAFRQPAVCGNHMSSNLALASLQQIPQEQPISNQLKRLIQSVEMLQSQHTEESSVTKEQIGSLAKSLDELRVGMDDGDGAHALQAMQGDTLLTTVGRMDNKLRDITDLIENMGSTGNSKEKVLSELVDEIRAVVSTLRSPISAPTTPGELPPPAPKVFFGRGELVETIVDLTQRFTSIALTGTGGIGKTSIILAVLNDHRTKRRFGDRRSFIRCDQITPTHTHFLRKLSEVTGAGVENPEDLSPMRRYLSSREMVIVLDNAEYILGLPETSAQELHAIVDELSQFSNICLAITSRISNALPAHCKIIEIPTLSMEAGHEMFYHIYKRGEQSDRIGEILKELDFHPLSLTLLATVAQQNRWNAKRLRAEWERQRTRVLRTRNLGSLATTIELSLGSPMFRELGSDAREVLGAVAFFPQGVNEDNIDGLFPTISDGLGMFDTFCNLSLAHRDDGFMTMLAPLRDHLRPKDPMASTLLRTAKAHYFMRLLVDLSPGEPGFDESKWITSGDVNVEHLLDVFTSIDAGSRGVWAACVYFMNHLFWHKPRLVVFGSKIEALPDSQPSKPDCLVFLSRLFGRVGKPAEQKRILIRSLGLWKKCGDEFWVAETLVDLAGANRDMGLYEEGIQQAREASEIFGRFGKKGKQAHCLSILASSLCQTKQFDAAEEVASRAINLSENPFDVCRSHQVLGEIHETKGNIGMAILHGEACLQTASSLGSDSYLLSSAHTSLATLYAEAGWFNDAHAHIEHARSHAPGNDIFQLGDVIQAGAFVLCRQGRLEEGKSEALRALAIFEKLGASGAVERTRRLLKKIQENQ